MLKRIIIGGVLCTNQLLAQVSTGVEFLSIIPVQNYSTIEWRTVSEQKNSYFTIEKSKDGVKFTKILDIPVSSDNSSYKEYVETDYQPYNQLSYYRIKVTAANGSYGYFPDSKGMGYTPLKNNEGIELFKTHEIIAVLQDAEGTEFSTKLLVTQKNNDFFADDTNKIVPPGIYTVISSSDEIIYGQKVIVK